MVESATARVHYVDWLRILAVLLLFPFHTLRVFNGGEAFYVKASVVSEPVNEVLGFISVWRMPLLLFLAGSSTYLALGRRSGGTYAWERIKRLVIPLVFGVLILIPPQTWCRARFNSSYDGSYRHYVSSGDFFRWNINDAGDYFGGVGVGQLWFIMFLFVCAVGGTLASYEIVHRVGPLRFVIGTRPRWSPATITGRTALETERIGTSG